MPSIPHRFSFTALLLLLLQFLQLQNCFAQAPLVKQWDCRFGGNMIDWLWLIEATNDGGYLLSGFSESDAGGDISQSNLCCGNPDFWIIKIDSLGIKQWDRRYGGFGVDRLYAEKQTTDGGFILGGVSGSHISGDKSEDTKGGLDFWIIKIDSLGNKQWDRDYGGNESDHLYALQQTIDGGYIMGGYTKSDSSGDISQQGMGSNNWDFWVVKTDSFGSKQWDKRFYGNFDDQMFAILQTTDRGFLLGGNSDSDSGYCKTQPSWGANDFWVIKIDSNGIEQWDKRYGGIHYDQIGSLGQTSDGGYLLAGKSNSGISGDKTHDTKGGFDYWVVKIDSAGNKLWDQDFGGTNDENEFGNMVITQDGGFLLGGISFSDSSGDKSENNLGVWQTWAVKVDSAGIKQWDKTLLTVGQDWHGLAIQDKKGSYILGNYTEAGIGGIKTQQSRGSFDFWVVKYSDTILMSSSPFISLSSSDTTFCEKNCLDFFDLTTNNPTSWQWHFPGASPDTSTLQNPTNICYNTYGTYNVTLVACNQFGCDSITFSNFITCYQNPVDSIWGANDTLWSTVAVSYQWYETTIGIIAGATNQYYVPLQLGSYFCVVTDSNGCEAASNIIVISGLPNPSKGGAYMLIPNPAIDFVEVFISPFGGQGAWFLEIFDVNGSIVIHQSIEDKNKINISSIAKGVYGYRIISNQKILQQGKLVKM